jgi:hypothetical protein
LTFAYLIPGLLVHSFAFMVVNKKKVDVINAQGLVASLIGSILKAIFGKRSVVTVHTVYNLEKRPMLGKIFAWILKANDCVLLYACMHGFVCCSKHNQKR